MRVSTWCLMLMLALFAGGVPTTFNGLSADEPKDGTEQAEPTSPADAAAEDDEEKAAEEDPTNKKEVKDHEGGDDEDGDREDGDDETTSDEKEIKIKCYFVAQQEERVILRPLEWSSFPILEVVEHGARVQRGDTLIAMDSRKLEAAIEDLESEIAEAELSLAQQEQELEISLRADRLALEAAERGEQRAAENLKRFVTQERSDRLESLERSVKSAENRLAYAQEEYDQLKRMYEADDLTEDTEEIILRRTRDSVESSEFSLDRYRKSRERGEDVDLPRTQIGLEESLRKATLALERARITLPRNEDRLTIALERSRLALERKQQRLARLEEDRQLMKVTAPISGWVYYGGQRYGKWSDSGQLAAALRVGLSAKANMTLMTVVRADELQLQGHLTEEDYGRVAVGAEGQAKPTAFPDTEFSVSITSISAVPVSEGKFVATMQVEAGLPEEIKATPGMTCAVVFQDGAPERD